MATISKVYTFEASHFIPEHQGKCREMHGHSYVVEVFLTDNIAYLPGSPQHGMVVDYFDMDKIIKPLIDLLDHKTLNDIIGYPTAEIIALWFYGHLVNSGDEQVVLATTQVIVKETAKTTAMVTEVDWVDYIEHYRSHPGEHPVLCACRGTSGCQAKEALANG